MLTHSPGVVTVLILAVCCPFLVLFRHGRFVAFPYMQLVHSGIGASFNLEGKSPRLAISLMTFRRYMSELMVNSEKFGSEIFHRAVLLIFNDSDWSFFRDVVMPIEVRYLLNNFFPSPTDPSSLETDFSSSVINWLSQVTIWSSSPCSSDMNDWYELNPGAV
jgi:hypothetical protein